MRFSPLVERIGGDSARAWDIHFNALKRAARGEKILFLSVGEPDFETPAPVVAAAKASLDKGRTHYSPISGERRLREAIAQKQSLREGRPIAPEQVTVTAGTQSGVFSTMMCVAGPGDEVIVIEPAYVTYPGLIGASGATLVTVPTEPEDGFHPDPERIAAAVTPRTRAILLATPNNPAGTVLRRGELEAIAAICKRHDLWLISDEVYDRLVFDGEHVSPAGLPGMAGRTATVSSLSKSHAMTGWRIGWVIGPPQLAAHLHDLLLCMVYGLPSFTQDAAVAALALSDEDLDGMRTAYKRRRTMVQEILSGVAGLVPRPAEGGMFTLLDVRGTGLSAYDFAEGLLAETNVCTLPADAFGPSTTGHVRLSLGTGDAELAEACRQIARFAGEKETRKQRAG